MVDTPKPPDQQRPPVPAPNDVKRPVSQADWQEKHQSTMVPPGGRLPDAVGKAPDCKAQSHHNGERVLGRSDQHVGETVNKVVTKVVEATVVPVVEAAFGGSSASAPVNERQARTAPERQSYGAQAVNVAALMAPVPGGRAVGQLAKGAEKGLVVSAEKAATAEKGVTAGKATTEKAVVADKAVTADKATAAQQKPTVEKTTTDGQTVVAEKVVTVKLTPAEKALAAEKGKPAVTEKPLPVEKPVPAEKPTAEKPATEKDVIATKNAEGDVLSANAEKALKTAMSDTRPPVKAEDLGRVGTVSNRPGFRAEVAKLVADKDHPLHFLVADGKLKSGYRMDQVGWRESPAAVEAGHVTSKKSLADGSNADRFVVMSAHHNRWISATVEHPGKGGGWMETDRALLIGGVPVHPETAADWVAAGLLRPEVLAQARHVVY